MPCLKQRDVLIAVGAMAAEAATSKHSLRQTKRTISRRSQYRPWSSREMMSRLSCKEASLLQAKLLKHRTLKIYTGFSHGIMTTNAGVSNADVLAFIRS